MPSWYCRPATPFRLAAMSNNNAVLGLLAVHQVIEDNAKVTSITSRWDNTVSAGVVLVTVEPAMAAAEV
jgi:hypothetical protein